MKRIVGALAALAALALVLAGCSSGDTDSTSSAASSAAASQAAKPGDPNKPDPRTPGWDIYGNPINGGPVGADGSTGNNLGRDYCSHNQDPACPRGSYVGQFTGYHGQHGSWDANGQPVNGGPVGADGSTGNKLTQEYCARNQDPACPKGSYVSPDAQRDPKGGPHYVKCEGTICTNPNHGAGTDPRGNGGDRGATGVWDANGKPIAGGPVGSDGSTNNNLTQQYCASNQDPACPAGSYVQPDQQQAPPEPGQQEFQGPGADQPEAPAPQDDDNQDDQGGDTQNGDGDQGGGDTQNDGDQNDGDQDGDN